MATLAQLLAYARADQRVLRSTSRQSARVAGLLWDRLVADANDATMERLVAAVVPRVEAFSLSAATNTAGFVNGYVGLADPDNAPSIALDGIDEFSPSAVRGTPLDVVYARPIVTARTALADGKPLDEALAIGRARLVSTAATDPVLSARAAARWAMEQAPNVAGYRRVPGVGACPFCLVASTQRYKVSDLRPLHSFCTCGVVPIVGDRDPGQIIDRDLYRQLKAAEVTNELALTSAVRRTHQSIELSQRQVADLRDELDGERDPDRRRQLGERIGRWEARLDDAERQLAERTARLDRHRAEFGTTRSIAVHEHGELGPVLTAARHEFTGPSVAA